MLYRALCVVGLAVCGQAATIVSLPLQSPLGISLENDPTVIINGRVIDFTGSLNREFTNFLVDQSNLSAQFGQPVYRLTFGVRARDGLASLTGPNLPSPDLSFVNRLPNFAVGSTELFLFDFVVAGYGVPIVFTVTDIEGDVSQPQFSTPIPEPLAIPLVASGLTYLIFRSGGRRPLNHQR